MILICIDMFRIIVYSCMYMYLYNIYTCVPIQFCYHISITFIISHVQNYILYVYICYVSICIVYIVVHVHIYIYTYIIYTCVSIQFYYHIAITYPLPCVVVQQNFGWKTSPQTKLCRSRDTHIVFRCIKLGLACRV